MNALRATWDRRYTEQSNPFGDSPSAFLVEQSQRIKPGDPVLSLGEGDGRHAVWLARERGAMVRALDVSPVALAAAKVRAMRAGVELETEVADLLDYHWASDRYAVVLWFFAHFVKADQTHVAQGAWRALRPGGVLIGRLWTQHRVGSEEGGVGAHDLLAMLPGSRVHVLTDDGLLKGPGGRIQHHTDFVLEK